MNKTMIFYTQEPWIQKDANPTCREILHCVFENLSKKIFFKGEK